MSLRTARGRAGPRVPLRHGEGNKDHLSSFGGLAALSLDALSSVAYGPEAIVVVLVAAGTSALRLTLPVTLAITGLLVVLVISYCQVIAVHPDGGGAYAVGKKYLGATVSLLPADSLVIVPVGSISKLTQLALRAALSLGDEVVAVSVYPEAGERAAFRAEWDRWNPGVRLDILDSPHRSLVHPVVDYVRHAQQNGRQVAVLIPEIQPRRWRYRILQNQRGLLLATVLRASTDVVICTIPYRLTTR